MPLLLIPVALLLGLAALLVLVPLGWVQRYRFGKARRRLRPGWLRLNAWLLGASVPLLLAGAWVSGHWIVHASSFALAGLGIGAALGALSALITRFEPVADGQAYTPNRWLVLALTLLVVGRVVLAGWQLWRPRDLAGDSALMHVLADHASAFAVAGVLLGYGFAHTCVLVMRARRLRR